MVTSLSLCGTGQLAENQRFARLGSRGSVFSGGKNKEADFNCMTLNKLTCLRREGDSNSRYPFGVYTLSRRAS